MMKNLLLFFFTILCLLLFPKAKTNENYPDYLIYNLPEVKKALYEVYLSYYDLKSTYLQFGINIETYYRYTYNQPTVNIRLGTGSLRISNDYNYNYGLQLNWLIKTFGFIENLILSKEFIYASKVLNYDQVLTENYLKFYKTLYEIYKSYNNFSYSVQLKDYTAELLYNTKKLYDVGLLAKVDYLRVLSTYYDSQAQVNAAYQTYQTSLKNLYSFLYPEESLNKDLPLDSNLQKVLLTYGKYIEDYQGKILYLEDKLDKSVETSRISKILYSNIIAIDYQKKSALSENNPRLAIFSQYNRQRPSGFSRDYSFNIGFSLTWKIFDSGLSKNKALSIEQQKNILYKQYLRTLADLQNQKENLKSKFFVDYNLYKSYLANLEYKKESFRLMKLKYQNGMATYLDYLDSQNSLLQTVLNLKNYKNELFLDYVTYLYLNDYNLNFESIFSKLKN